MYSAGRSMMLRGLMEDCSGYRFLPVAEVEERLHHG